MSEGGLDDVFPAVRAHLLVHGGHAAKLSSRGSSRILWRQSARLERGRGIIDVLLDFVGDVAIRGRSMDERAKATRELPPQ
jgi:hypothetical protein